MTDAIVEITDRARAVLALGEEIDAVGEVIRAERIRHQKAMATLNAKKGALEEAIFKLSGGHH